MDTIVILIVAVAVVSLAGWFAVSWRRRRITAGQAMAPTLDKVRAAGDEALADSIEEQCQRAAQAKVAAVDYLLQVAPARSRPALVRVREQETRTGPVLIAIGEAEHNLHAQGYVHVRHHIREVLMFRDQLLKATAGFGGRDRSAAQETLAQANAKLQHANDRLFQLIEQRSAR